MQSAVISVLIVSHMQCCVCVKRVLKDKTCENFVCHQAIGVIVSYDEWHMPYKHAHFSCSKFRFILLHTFCTSTHDFTFLCTFHTFL